MSEEGGTCEVWFYHLERSSLDEVLPELLEKTLQRGWRALVRSPDRDRIEQLDARLWTYRDEGFLPHGVAGEPHAERQPVLLTTAEDNPNRADALFLLDGAQAGDLAGFQRCLTVFDGADEAALAQARAAWKTYKGRGLPVSYWRQTDRGWEKQA
jgi:DNA polymerase-3 subunit chi